jgi:hypothetical protein
VQDSDCQIRSFQEVLGESESPTVSSTTHVIDEQNPACYVDFIPATANRGTSQFPPDIIVVHVDGRVTRLSGSLQEVRWTMSGIPPKAEDTSRPQVVCAQWISHADASRGLLRRRADILKASAASNSSFLLLVYLDKSHDDAQFIMGVFEVPSISGTNSYSSNSIDALRLLISNPIPASKWWTESTDVQFYFHAPTARLSMSSDRELSTFDLSRYEIGASSKFVTVDGFVSVFPIAANLVAAASSPAVQIYDVDFHSVQVSYDLNKLLKQKGRNDTTDKSVRFISYFPKINLLVARLGRCLIGFQLPETINRNQSYRAGNRLIDSLGRGAYQSRTAKMWDRSEVGFGTFKPLSMQKKQTRSRWEARKKELDNLVAQKEGGKFEQLMTTELSAETMEGEPAADRLTSELPDDQQFVRDDRIEYLLSKMFRIPRTADKSKGEKKLALVFVPDQLFRWLARRSCLSTNTVQRALLRQPIRPQLKLGAVAQSIIERDPSLSLLLDYLQAGNLSNGDEMMVIIKALIRIGVAAAENGPGHDSLWLEDARNKASNGSQPNGNISCASPSGPAMAGGGLPRHHSSAMNRVLEIFCSLSPSKMTSAVRRHFDSDESLALIQYLRQQLFRSGHTSSSLGLNGISADPVPALETIALVLSSCIDALGPARLVGSAFGQSNWQDLVPDLKMEISLALGAIEEATYLRGIIQEMVRHGDATDGRQTFHGQPSSPEQLRIQPAEMALERATRIDSERAEDEGQDLTGFPSMLPLGLNMEEKVTRNKKRKGGGEIQQRSARELHYLQDRKVGRYRFERIIV